MTDQPELPEEFLEILQDFDRRMQVIRAEDQRKRAEFDRALTEYREASERVGHATRELVRTVRAMKGDEGNDQ